MREPVGDVSVPAVPGQPGVDPRAVPGVDPRAVPGVDPRAVPAVTEATVLAALRAAAGGGSPEEVAQGLLSPLLRLAGVRAGAVVLGAGRRSGPRVVASAGYACGAFDPGSLLPHDAGLPVTDAATTGRTVIRGTGPSWVAVPVAPGGALLLSLTGPPPSGVALARLEAVGAAAGPALARAAADQAARHEHALLAAGLGAADAEGWRAGAEALAGHGWDVEVRSEAFGGELGGDVVVIAARESDVVVVVADVSGRGSAAAAVATRIRAAVAVLLPHVDGPCALLEALSPAVPPTEEGFVTALALFIRGDQVVAASAGHPPHVLHPDVGPAGSCPPPGLPLGLPLDLGSPLGAADGAWHVTPGGLVVLHTDGLVDRTSEVDLTGVLAAGPTGSAREVADGVLVACAAVGPSQDDLSLVVLRRSATR